ncbi:MAG: hypothetical protein HY791_32250 [Deltaproteobacteria bacterium]|nr:hypothetical protein [Deltaproteobacteria bacterium]
MPHVLAPRRGVCRVCGRDLGDAPHWITTPPDGEHERCRDWDRVPFPLERELEELRKVARALAEGYRITVKLGRWLSDARSRWPEGTWRVLEEYRTRKSELDRRLERLRKRMKG